MKKIVLLRHGQSLWNLENKFTGWTDVPLTQQGINEARHAGALLKEQGFNFEKAYTSYLCRAVNTLNYVLEELNQEWIPVEKSWRLNEKHYGALQGLNKQETSAKYGEKQVQLWRRAYLFAPPPLPKQDPRLPYFDLRYQNVPTPYLPDTESLKDCVERVLPFWQERIFPALETHGTLLVVAHGNTLRAIIKHIKKINDEKIMELNLPTGVPFVMEFNGLLELSKDYFLGNQAEIAAKMQAVADQGKKNP